MTSAVLTGIGRGLVGILTKPVKGYEPAYPPDAQALARVLRPADVLLVEGNTRVSIAIKYLTQSTWSHAAMFVGDVMGRKTPEGEPHVLVEATIEGGVASAPLSKYRDAHVRVCRPIALTPEDRESVIRFMVERIGYGYDVKNVVDLMRYLLPQPPVPLRFRRRLLAFGSGEPTRTICSTLIAQAFQSVRYPILPRVKDRGDDRKVKSEFAREEILHIRHHTLYAPRDFDISPYFAIVKPTIETGFDYKRYLWGEDRPVSAREPMRRSA
ncbi:lipo-like protein [Chelatococcus albus]|uniref:lipo-like protein n=1 Tax=Chelatococcus albus TaxID=3047466 RepID=UPI0030EF825A